MEPDMTKITTFRALWVLVERVILLMEKRRDVEGPAPWPDREGQEILQAT